MAPLIKVKVINKVKGQFGTANQPKEPMCINLQSGHCNIRHVSKLFFNGKVNFSKVNVILGHMTVPMCYLLSSTKANDNKLACRCWLTTCNAFQQSCISFNQVTTIAVCGNLLKSLFAIFCQ